MHSKNNKQTCKIKKWYLFWAIASKRSLTRLSAFFHAQWLASTHISYPTSNPAVSSSKNPISSEQILGVKILLLEFAASLSFLVFPALVNNAAPTIISLHFPVVPYQNKFNKWIQKIQRQKKNVESKTGQKNSYSGKEEYADWI